MFPLHTAITDNGYRLNDGAGRSLVAVEQNTYTYTWIWISKLTEIIMLMLAGCNIPFAGTSTAAVISALVKGTSSTSSTYCYLLDLYWIAVAASE